MNKRRQALGRWGEEIATRYLEGRGYAILARNLRTAHGELDIVASKEGMLVFVEVKARSSVDYGFPEEAVSLRKQAHLLAAAEAYLAQHPDSPETWQFDIIAITFRTGQVPEIEHFENVIR
ncbi:MAG: YraN family protein [Anaerolineales bacterium]|nr:YraN family protein [Anaerolineales bacterium]MCX7608035.1 YraN family protein [Anaerolineales bacterium]MDW8227499.1 YraN family protein [Anaerolineales bacterium]